MQLSPRSKRARGAYQDFAPENIKIIVSVTYENVREAPRHATRCRDFCGAWIMSASLASLSGAELQVQRP